MSGSVLFLIGANQVVFSPAMLAAGVVLAATSAAAGVWLRRGGRQRLGVGVIIGAVAAVPVELVLSWVWALVVVTFLSRPTRLGWIVGGARHDQPRDRRGPC